MTPHERELLLYAAMRVGNETLEPLNSRFYMLIDSVSAAQTKARSAPRIPGTELVGTSPHPILGMAVINDQVIVATTHGVFERGQDGKFFEVMLPAGKP